MFYLTNCEWSVGREGLLTLKYQKLETLIGTLPSLEGLKFKLKLILNYFEAGDLKQVEKKTVENDRQNCGRRNLIEVIQSKNLIDEAEKYATNRNSS